MFIDDLYSVIKGDSILDNDCLIKVKTNKGSILERKNNFRNKLYNYVLLKKNE
jgi:hypothetical protein